jgi:hypothetical protein
MHYSSTTIEVLPCTRLMTFMQRSFAPLVSHGLDLLTLQQTHATTGSRPQFGYRERKRSKFLRGLKNTLLRTENCPKRTFAF